MAMHNIDVDGAVQRITEKMEWVSERSKDKIPYKTVNGVHDDLSRSDINWWTNGFWPGIQWLLYHETGSQKHADIAREAERKLDRCFEEYYGIHHDAGFMWLLSAAAGLPSHRRSAGEKARAACGEPARRTLQSRRKFHPRMERHRQQRMGDHRLHDESGAALLGVRRDGRPQIP